MAATGDWAPVVSDLSGVRPDRILDEARTTSDPVHLMRVFDITADTAMSYIYAAQPDKHPTRLE
jgi:hypothetical protein